MGFSVLARRKISCRAGFCLVNPRRASTLFTTFVRMNLSSRTLLASFAAIVIGIAGASSAHAQQSKVIGEKPTFDDLPSPEFGGGKQKAFKPNDWLEIETKLRISLSPEPKSKTCDKLTVRWYIAVKNPDKPGTFLLLTRNIDHVNVPIEEDVHCSVYLSPASIRRLTGSGTGGKNSVEYVGYEVLINGEKKAEDTNKGKAGWWNTSSNNISRSDAVPLLNKSETPFNAMWWDRYAEVDMPDRR
jgi:hypothetical protein